ncbi:DUF1002 domain-containing protein [Clostridium kluyveri]|uniref:DUF1002 domain-containing protein n=2 Tax=Clostridium kluyveri TaxID=1534 RepID=A5MZ79_CLOK5|nr:DUF1002 domain-containing protein [Clostridium kluyveri]EDK34175.1 Conserved hypothetical protein [Clostridium kluyveri DSM 555]BAH06949.1 hypothetical protein CKR_1898 [Clostridium kluyveri NBRC 12016]
MKCKIFTNKLLILFMVLSVVLVGGVNKVQADAYKVVTLGGNLTEQQKNDMLEYFKVNKQEVNVIEVNIDEEKKYLGDVASSEQIGTKSISCAYVEPTSSGGLQVSTNNIYWVSSSMIKNALITAGIKNANVKASAPFNVSGTAALTGILKGFENSTAGNKIDEETKKVANDELVTTGNLGDKIGKDEAAGLINEIKTEVVKENPKTEGEIKNIVQNVVNNYNFNLSSEDVDKIVSLMSKINGLNLNFSDLKDQLNSVASQLKGSISSEEAKGFFAKIIEAIKNFFSGLF